LHFPLLPLSKNLHFDHFDISVVFSLNASNDLKNIGLLHKNSYWVKKD